MKTKYFFFQLHSYIAYDNMNMMLPNASGQGHIARVCRIFYSDFVMKT